MWLPIAVAALIAVVLLALGVRVHWFARRLPQSPQGEAIVVLGARLSADGQPSPAFLGRIERAVELYRAGAAPLLLFSGGGRPSEARAAMVHACTMGVEEAVCVLEEESTNTLENARHSARLLKARGALRVVVVTDGFHLLRAVRLFRLYGLEPVPAASRRRLRWSTALFATLKEALAYLRVPPRPF